jgi:hypothetical protein
MTDTRFTVELSPAIAGEVERLAREAGVTPAEFVAAAAVARVADAADAGRYCAQRAARARKGAARRFYTPTGGEPPRPGDEIG